VLVSAVAPKQSFFAPQAQRAMELAGKVRDRKNAFASTRDACATHRVARAASVCKLRAPPLYCFNALTNHVFTMPAANDLRRGMAIKYNGNPAIVLEVHHRTPGNLRAFVQAIIRYINTGKSADVRFGSTDKVELVSIERKQLDFSYKDRNGYHFMDPETYDTITLQENLIGDAKDYLVENLAVQVLYAEGKPVQVELPASVSLKVVESAEGVRGDTASNVTKPAKLETGKTINVPLFIKEGEAIKIDTRTGVYMGRA
jgi:elongation factor P